MAGRVECVRGDCRETTSTRQGVNVSNEDGEEAYKRIKGSRSDCTKNVRVESELEVEIA